MNEVEEKYYNRRWEGEAAAAAPPNPERVGLVTSHALDALRGRSRPAVIDVGCGNGWILDSLARGAGDSADLYGIEPSEIGVATTRGRVPGATVWKGTLGSVELPQRFDVAVSSEVIEHVEDQGEFARDLADLLVDGGTLVLTTPNGAYRDSYFDHPSSAVRPQPVEKWLDARGLDRLFAGRFRVAHRSTFDLSHYYTLHPGLGRLNAAAAAVRGAWRAWHTLIEAPCSRLLGLGLYQLVVLTKVK